MPTSGSGEQWRRWTFIVQIDSYSKPAHGRALLESLDAEVRLRFGDEVKVGWQSVRVLPEGPNDR